MVRAAAARTDAGFANGIFRARSSLAASAAKAGESVTPPTTETFFFGDERLSNLSRGAKGAAEASSRGVEGGRRSRDATIAALSTEGSTEPSRRGSLFAKRDGASVP
jgi:hypothetical protein